MGLELKLKNIRVLDKYHCNEEGTYLTNVYYTHTHIHMSFLSLFIISHVLYSYLN